MRGFFAERGMPIELASLPHVESSFNPHARSHVGASGLWQFTRSTGRLYMRVDHVIDERNDPWIATVAASRLLAANYQKTQAWPLALTGYNHGVGGMVRAIQQLGTRDMATITRATRAAASASPRRTSTRSSSQPSRSKRTPSATSGSSRSTRPTARRSPSCRATFTPRPCVGYLALIGAALPRREQDLLVSASEFLAARIVHHHCREVAVQHEQESALLGQLAERCLNARDVEEILPLALDAAMHGLRARRGSILLAEERGRITARALRGDHASISDTIQTLPPGSVSHRVFHERQPILVHDIDREPHLKRDREFPYMSRSFVSVPLRDDGRSLGVLHLTEREGAGAFTQRDLTWLERLILQASGAIRREMEVNELPVMPCCKPS